MPQVMPRMLTLWLDHGRDTEVAKDRIKEEKDRDKAKHKEAELADLARARAKNLKVRQLQGSRSGRVAYLHVHSI